MHRPTDAGHTFQIDGFGHVGTKAVGGSSTYQWLAVDAVSGVIYDMLTCKANQATLFEVPETW